MVFLSVNDLRKHLSEAVTETAGSLQHPTVDRDYLNQKFGFPSVDR